MTDEEIRALPSEYEKFRIKVKMLMEQLAQSTSQLQAAIVRIAGLEKEKRKPPPFV